MDGGQLAVQHLSKNFTCPNSCPSQAKRQNQNTNNPLFDRKRRVLMKTMGEAIPARENDIILERTYHQRSSTIQDVSIRDDRLERTLSGHISSTSTWEQLQLFGYQKFGRNVRHCNTLMTEMFRNLLRYCKWTVQALELFVDLPISLGYINQHTMKLTFKNVTGTARLRRWNSLASNSGPNFFGVDSYIGRRAWLRYLRTRRC